MTSDTYKGSEYGTGTRPPESREPREWWINIYTHTVFKEDLSAPSGIALRMDPLIIHVVEFNAYEKLTLERDELKFELEAKQRPLGKQVLELTIELDKLTSERDELKLRLADHDRMYEALEYDKMEANKERESLSKELVACIKERDQLKAELERVKEICNSVNRAKNSFFEQSYKNFQKAASLKAKLAVAREALEKIAAYMGDAAQVLAEETLLKLEGEK